MKCPMVLLLLLTSATIADAGNPEDPGPQSFNKTTRTEKIAGQDVTFDLFVPQGLSSPGPVAVIGHGFQRNKDKVSGWGEALARRGYVAAALDFPGMLPDHQVNGELMAGLLGWLVAQGSAQGSAVDGLVDGTRRAVIGHSAGGLAAYLAAAKDSAIKVVIGLDPVDNNDLGKKAAPALKAATMIVRATPGTCNSQGNAEQLYQAYGGPKVTLRVKGANHCDPESPSDSFCGMFCGGDADPARHAIFLRYALAMLDYVLRCDDAMAPWLGGPSAQADTTIEDLHAASLPPTQASCGAPALPDGGPSADAGAPADAALPPPPDAALPPDANDPGPDPDAATAASDAASTDDGSGSGGCHLAGDPSLAAPPLLLIALALMLLGRRRHEESITAP